MTVQAYNIGAVIWHICSRWIRREGLPNSQSPRVAEGVAVMPINLQPANKIVCSVSDTNFQFGPLAKSPGLGPAAPGSVGEGYPGE